MDGLVYTAVKGEIMFVSIDSELADKNWSIQNSFFNARLDIEAFVLFEFAGTDLEDRVAFKRRPQVNLS